MPFKNRTGKKKGGIGFREEKTSSKGPPGQTQAAVAYGGITYMGSAFRGLSHEVSLNIGILRDRADKSCNSALCLVWWQQAPLDTLHYITFI